MSGLLTKKLDAVCHPLVQGLAGQRSLETLCTSLILEIPDVVRWVVENSHTRALDAKADREALIRDLIEALC